MLVTGIEWEKYYRLAVKDEEAMKAVEGDTVRERLASTSANAPERQRIGDWMQLYGSKSFWPLDPKPEEICIQAIAHSLSMQCRYNGHVHTFYSTAEHSVLMARWLWGHGYSHEVVLWALLHDAPEALGLSDMIRPVKQNVTGYKAMEDATMRAVCDRFDLPHDMPAIVKIVDTRILNDEMKQAMQSPPMKWSIEYPEPLGALLQFWTPSRAEREFLNLFEELYGED